MFQEKIRAISQSVPDAENVILAGMDGIIVARYRATKNDDSTTVEAAELIRECTRFGSELGSGDLQHLVFSFDDKTVVIQMINEDYFFVGIINNTQYIGKLKYQLKLKSYECYPMVS